MQGIQITKLKLLNCIFDNPEKVYKISSEYWQYKFCEDYCEAIKELYDNKVDITIDNIVSVGNNKNNEITIENISKMREYEYKNEEFDFYLKELKKLWAGNIIHTKLMKEVFHETYKKDGLDVDVINDLARKMRELTGIIVSSDTNIHTIEDVIEEYEIALVKRKRGEWKASTGDSFLDKHLSQGFVAGEITTIFGATGVGKSVFALNLVNRQMNKRIPSVYFTLEMSAVSTMDRLMAMREKLVITDGMEEDDRIHIWEELRVKAKKLKKYRDRILIVDNPALDLDMFEKVITEAQERIGSQYLVATIDLLTMMKDVGQKAYDIEDAMNRLHSIVKTKGIHCVVVVQANREADSMKVGKIDDIYKLRPNINHVKNAHAIAERSRIVMSVFRPKYFAERRFPEDDELELMNDILEVQILKQSSGRVGDIVRYLYVPKYFSLLPFRESYEKLNTMEVK